MFNMREIKAALCYTGIISFFYLRSRDPFLKFHSKQGFVLFIMGIISFIIPLVGWAILLPLLFVTDIVAINRALNGQEWNVPIVKFFTKFLK